MGVDESSDLEDRIVFMPYTPEDAAKQAKFFRWYRWAGAVMVITGLAFLAIGHLSPMTGYFILGGAAYFFMPRIQRWEQSRHLYVDRTEVSWSRQLRARDSVLLSDIASVSTDTENPRWATHVTITLTDGSTRRLATATPARLLEVLQARTTSR